MQTIKTAAIVVLMLTVLYGGYVSLTTPPEPLPDEVEQYLVIEESEGDPLLMESIAPGLELSEPPPSMVAESSPPAIDPLMPVDAATEPQFGSPQPEPTALSAPPASFGSSFADLPPTRSETDASPASFELSGPSKLPSVDSSGPAVTPPPGGAYASTEESFSMPDPSNAPSSFDPGRGEAFVSPSSETATPDVNEPATSATAMDTLGAPRGENRGLINAFASADQMYAKGQLKEALETLSVFYGMPDLSETERQQLLGRLDPLAREVIYSRRHLLEQPYRIAGNETLVKVAGKFDVPWQLLANINRVDDPITVLPGTELKVMQGPFRAEVDLTRKELTLFLGDLYAGRFQVEIGNDPPPTEGTFAVQEKQTEHVYYDRTGVPVPAGSANNPYGNMWLDLGGQLCIHGSPNTMLPSKLGCISLAGDQADDLYGILSQGSAVTIRR